jgi:L-seryl-tRNA(Ser) seleniumtransferase
MNLYEQLGIKTVINAWGTLTMLGGSLMEKETTEVIKEAAGYFVDMSELHEKAGQKVAELLGVEAACITSGAAAGIAISAAACMAGTNKANILQLPDTHGMKNEVIILKCHRTLYDQALLLSGAKVIEIGSASFACIEMLEKAITEKTCMFFYASEAESLRGSLKITDLVPVLKSHSVPLVIDAAAELPPKSNIVKYLDEGADLVVFSGGKEIRGPQSSGVIVGRKDLIRACDLNCCPNHSIGRSMKIDKETIIGCVKAIELFMKRDYDQEMRRWESWVDRVINTLSHKQEIKIWKGIPQEPGVEPRIIPRAYITSNRESAAGIQKKLLNCVPAIKAGIEGGALAINPQCLYEDQIQIVIDKLEEVL